MMAGLHTHLVDVFRIDAKAGDVVVFCTDAALRISVEHLRLFKSQIATELAGVRVLIMPADTRVAAVFVDGAKLAPSEGELRPLLAEIRQHYTRDDDLPDNLLARIDQALEVAP